MRLYALATVFIIGFALGMMVTTVARADDEDSSRGEIAHHERVVGDQLCVWRGDEKTICMPVRWSAEAIELTATGVLDFATADAERRESR